MNNIHRLSNNILINSYNQAKKLKLDSQFIKMLKEELQRRSINIYNIVN